MMEMEMTVVTEVEVTVMEMTTIKTIGNGDVRSDSTNERQWMGQE